MRLPDELVTAAKRRAVETRRTLSDIVEEALRMALAPEAKAGDAAPVQLPSFGSGGVLPGAEIDDTSALLDLMEGR